MWAPDYEKISMCSEYIDSKNLLFVIFTNRYGIISEKVPSKHIVLLA